MKRIAAEKPQKPYAGYPLNAHASGQWAKSVHGVQHYFGPWADHVGALQRYLALTAGLALPSPDTVGKRVDEFMAEQRAQLATGGIAPVTFKEYEATCKVIADHYGKSCPVESLEYNSLRIALAKGKRVATLGANTLKRRLIIARMVFHDQAASIRPLKPPSSKQLRDAKAARGEQLYSAADVRALVTAADHEFRWVILLGINCAFSPKDCQYFPAHNNGEEWHDFARVKTGVPRRCWLWPETRKALKHQCEGWDRFNISKTFADLCESTGVTNHGHYSLKRTFVTFAVGTAPAVDRICGWTKPDMATVYRQQTLDDQIRAVAESVRNWYLSRK